MDGRAYWGLQIQTSGRDLASVRERISYGKSTYMRVWYVPNVDSAFAPGKPPSLYKPLYDDLRTYSDLTGHRDVTDNLSPAVIRLAHGDGSSGRYFIFIYRSSTARPGDDHDASRYRVIQHSWDFVRYMRSIGEAKGRITMVATSATALISGLSASFFTDVDPEMQMPLDTVPQSTTSDKAQQAGIRAANRTVTEFIEVIGAHIIYALTRRQSAVVLLHGTNAFPPAG